MRRRAFMPPPAAGAQVVAGTEEFKKGLRHALVDVEEGTHGGIEPFNSAGSAMPVVEKILDGIKEFIRLGAAGSGLGGTAQAPGSGLAGTEGTGVL